MFASVDWATISALATAAGTLVLAVATFASVRSANHAARVAERSFQFSLQPILSPSRLEDPDERIMYGDRHWVTLRGGQAAVEELDGNIYLAMQVRNVGNGVAVIEGWQPFGTLRLGGSETLRTEHFRHQTRSLWVPPGDRAFWQGALRDPGSDLQQAISAGVASGELGVDLLYRDHEASQWTVSRFSMIRDDDGERWWASMNLHRPYEGVPPGFEG
jgi:hypothetical protein